MNHNLRNITHKIENLKQSIQEIQREIEAIETLGYVVVKYSSQEQFNIAADRSIEWRMNVPHAAVLNNLENLVIEYTKEIKKLLIEMREVSLGE